MGSDLEPLTKEHDKWLGRSLIQHSSHSLLAQLLRKGKLRDGYE